jgi:integrase/recombinase XerD
VTQLRQKMLEELERRNYSHRTAKTYVRIIRDFAQYFHQPPDKLGPEQIRQYQAYLFQTKKLTTATVSQYVSALRFLYVKTLRRHFLSEYIPFPKSPRRLPIVLSPEEVTQLINSAANLFHRTLLMTLYSTAIRRSELCRLKATDIDSQRMMIRVQGKGRHERDIPLSPKLLEALRVYWRWMKPKTYLFPGTVHHHRADVPISANAVWHACHSAAKAAGIAKRLSPHSLRHSSATHLLTPRKCCGRCSPSRGREYLGKKVSR